MYPFARYFFTIEIVLVHKPMILSALMHSKADLILTLSADTQSIAVVCFIGKTLFESEADYRKTWSNKVKDLESNKPFL